MVRAIVSGSVMATVIPCSAQIRSMFASAYRRESSRVNGMRPTLGPRKSPCAAMCRFTRTLLVPVA